MKIERNKSTQQHSEKKEKPSLEHVIKAAIHFVKQNAIHPSRDLKGRVEKKD